MKSFVSLILFIIQHPFNKSRRLQSLLTFFKWQTVTRILKTKHLINWVDNSTFIASKGETGLTGNLYCGFMEYEDMSFVLHFIRKTDTFYDIGANVGAFTILASGVRGCKSICFEPLEKTFNKLVDQININRINSLVDARNNGVGNKNTILEFTNDLNAMNKVNIDNNNNNNTSSVEVITLDDNFVPNGQTIVKIDVEGYESFVLEGGKNFFKSLDVIGIIIELNGTGHLYNVLDEDIHSELVSLGFTPISYDPFNRKIITLSNYNSDGNTIYVRDVDVAMKRCLDAEEFCIHTVGGLVL
jgi:FkbM family methyltransferase